jgi:hypothetical protein
MSGRHTNATQDHLPRLIRSAGVVQSHVAVSRTSTTGALGLIHLVTVNHGSSFGSGK